MSLRRRRPALRHRRLPRTTASKQRLRHPVICSTCASASGNNRRHHRPQQTPHLSIFVATPPRSVGQLRQLPVVCVAAVDPFAIVCPCGVRECCGWSFTCGYSVWSRRRRCPRVVDWPPLLARGTARPRPHHPSRSRPGAAPGRPEPEVVDSSSSRSLPKRRAWYCTAAA